MLKPLHHLLHRFLFAFKHGFHASIVEVTHPTRNAQAFSFIGGALAEEYALDSAANEYVGSNLQRFTRCNKKAVLKEINFQKEKRNTDCTPSELTRLPNHSNIHFNQPLPTSRTGRLRVRLKSANRKRSFQVE
jgi:hypothetical protein